MYASNFISSGAYVRRARGRGEEEKNAAGRGRRETDGNGNCDQIERSHSKIGGRSGDREPRFAAHVSEIEENRIV